LRPASFKIRSHAATYSDTDTPTPRGTTQRSTIAFIRIVLHQFAQSRISLTALDCREIIPAIQHPRLFQRTLRGKFPVLLIDGSKDLP
jgi:hypothetical protein